MTKAVGEPVRVMDLLCGDVYRTAIGRKVCYVMQGPNPVFPGLQLMTVRNSDGSYAVWTRSLTEEVGVLAAMATPEQRRWAAGVEEWKKSG